HRVTQPPVVGLLRDLQHPTRHRDRHPHWGAGRGQLADERVDHFGLRSTPCDKYAAARRNTSFSCSNRRMRFFASRSSACSTELTPGLTPSSTSAIFTHRWTQDSEIPKSFAICANDTSRRLAIATTSSRNSLGNALGMANILPEASNPPQIRSH